MQKPKAKSKVTSINTNGLALQRGLVRDLSFHARRITDGIEDGAQSIDYYEIVCRNAARAFERQLLDAVFRDKSSLPLEHVVSLLTGMPMIGARVRIKKVSR